MFQPSIICHNSISFDIADKVNQNHCYLTLLTQKIAVYYVNTVVVYEIPFSFKHVKTLSQLNQQAELSNFS